MALPQGGNAPIAFEIKVVATTKKNQPNVGTSLTARVNLTKHLNSEIGIVIAPLEGLTLQQKQLLGERTGTEQIEGDYVFISDPQGSRFIIAKLSLLSTDPEHLEDRAAKIIFANMPPEQAQDLFFRVTAHYFGATLWNVPRLPFSFKSILVKRVEKKPEQILELRLDFLEKGAGATRTELRRESDAVIRDLGELARWAGKASKKFAGATSRSKHPEEEIGVSIKTEFALFVSRLDAKYMMVGRGGQSIDSTFFGEIESEAGSLARQISHFLVAHHLELDAAGYLPALDEVLRLLGNMTELASESKKLKQNDGRRAELRSSSPFEALAKEGSSAAKLAELLRKRSGVQIQHPKTREKYRPTGGG